MQASKHAQQRMSQRGITKQMLEMALMYGEIEQDKYVLGKKGAAEAFNVYRRVERHLLALNRQMKRRGKADARHG